MKVVIVGAGAIGLSTAYFCAKAGADVTVLDQASPGAGASRTNAGWVVPTMSDPVPSPAAFGKALRWLLRSDSPLHVGLSTNPAYIAFLIRMTLASRNRPYQRGLAATARLNERTRDAFEELLRDGVNFDLHRTGVLYAFLDVHQAEAHIPHLQAMAQYGNPMPQLLDSDAVNRLEPNLGDNVRAGILAPDERHLDPDQFIDSLVNRCQNMGVEIVQGEPVTGFELRGNQVGAAVGRQRWGADKFVLAAGAKSASLAATAGVKIPIQAGHGYGYDLYLDKPLLGRSVYLTDPKVALTPLPGRLRAAGTMEFGRSTDTVNVRRAQAILTATRQYLPALSPSPSATPWTGARPMTPDGLPMIGVAAQTPNLAIATGHAMLGITLAPTTGSLVADLLYQQDPSREIPPELEPFSPARFRRTPRMPPAPESPSTPDPQRDSGGRRRR